MTEQRPRRKSLSECRLSQSQTLEIALDKKIYQETRNERSRAEIAKIHAELKEKGNVKKKDNEAEEQKARKTMAAWLPGSGVSID